MRENIHPEYNDVVFKCACGAEHRSKSTTDKVSIAICSNCHPFYTGKQKFVDTAGRIEKFMRKYDKHKPDAEKAAAAATTTTTK